MKSDGEIHRSGTSVNVAQALRWTALAFGLAALVGLIMGSGVHQIWAALLRGGIQILVVPAYMLLPLVLDAWGWWVLVPNPPSCRHFAYGRWVGESVNTLLPVAQMGGLVVKAYLLGRQRVNPALAMASVLVAVTLAVASLIVFAMAGLALLTARDPHARILLPLAISLGVFIMAALAFYWLQLHGDMALPDWLRKQLAPLRSASGLTEGGERLGAWLKQIYSMHWRVWCSFLLQQGGWVIGAGEVWLSAHLLGAPISAIDALIMESLVQAVRNVAFFVPGALGLQEGAFVLTGAALGISPTMAVSISLVKRFRELSIGVPGLIAWQLGEGWNGLNRLASVPMVLRGSGLTPVALYQKLRSIKARTLENDQ